MAGYATLINSLVIYALILETDICLVRFWDYSIGLGRVVNMRAVAIFVESLSENKLLHTYRVFVI